MPARAKTSTSCPITITRADETSSGRRRMRRASARGKEEGIEEGILIAQEMLSQARTAIQGVQVSAPFGRVPLALRVFEALPGRGQAEPVLQAG